MKHKILSMTLPLCLLMALAAAFLFASPAFAQDEVPPVPEEAPVETTLPEALAETGVVLADESGEPIPLVSAEAAEALANGDPFFKVGTITYRFMEDCTGWSDCSPGANPIQRAIDAIAGGLIPTDGMLYFDSNTSYTEQVLIDNVAGLKGMIGGPDLTHVVSPDTYEPTVTINGTVSIRNMLSGFTINGFNIFGSAGTLADHPQGVLDIYSTAGALRLLNLVVRNTDPTGQGIALGPHTGTVEFNGVKSSGNAGGGAVIVINGTGSVTIKNSSFDDNGGDGFVNGLYISSNGAVLLDGVTVNYNGYNDGTYAAAFIDGSKALTVKNSVFSNNWSSGLVNYWTDAPFTSTNGPVLLDNVFANDNWYFFDIDNEYGGAGIALVTNGTFTANNVHANGNKFQGMIVDTCWSVEVTPGNWVCSTTAVGNVVISNSEFKHNNSESSGLFVDAKGAITLTNVDASWNRGYVRDTGSPEYGMESFYTAGARLNNYSFTTAYPVTINNSTFAVNIDDGLEINSKGLVTINKVNAYENSVIYDIDQNRIASFYGYGIDINNTGGTAGVTFKGLASSDNFIRGNAYGLRVNSNGAILINYLNSNDNTYINGYLMNLGGGNVTVNNSTFRSSWTDHGLVIATNGIVSMNTVSARWNSGTGLIIENSTSATPKAVTITNGYFSGNSGSGLIIESKGAITLKNVQANDNGEYGAHLVNITAITPQGVSISGSEFHGNQRFNGLLVESRGAVTLTNVSVSDNSLNDEEIEYGQFVYDIVGNNYSDSWWFNGVTGEVINLGLYYQNTNDWQSLYIELFDENGNLVYETASGDPVNSEYFGNDDYDSAITGFVLENDGRYRIQVSNWNWDTSGSYYAEFWEGTDPWAGDWNEITQDVNGLGIQTEGAVTITNPADGSYRIAYNNGYGLDILTKGLVKLTNINASYNASFGADILNRVDGATAGVTLIGSTFDQNDSYGLHIESNGVVLLTKTVANENWSYGANIDNRDDPARKMAVTITNDAARLDWWHEGFSGNRLDGLNISSYGIISLTNVNASDNGSTGAVLQNVAGYTDVKLTNSKFDDNDGSGVSVYTRGNIIFSKGTSNNNQGMNGAWFESYPYPGIKNVTISNVEFNGNFGSGLHVVTNGNISLTNVWANWNYGDDANGADLNNCGGQPCDAVAVTGNVTIKTGEFYSNNDTGLLIATRGNVTLSNINSGYNNGYGALIGTSAAPVKVVMFSGMNSFYDNGANGLEIHATGAITLANLDAGSNGWYGAILNNTYGALPANVTLLCNIANWTNWYGDNGDTGLHITTNGVVLLNKFDASSNNSTGVYIENFGAAIPANITINTAWAYDNNGNGLTIRTRGAVLISGLEASYNDQTGADINNAYDESSLKTVTINKSILNDNGGNGLEVYSWGNIVLNNVTANDNETGAYLTTQHSNPMGLAKGTVTLLSTLGANNFNNNHIVGLSITSYKNVVINGTTANNNGYGITVNNHMMGDGTGLVTLSKVTANYNSYTGIDIVSNGTVTIGSSVAMFNGLYDDLAPEAGFSIRSRNPLCKTTLTNSVAIGNGAQGIYLATYGGSYLFTNILYFGNDGSGDGYSNLLIELLP